MSVADVTDAVTRWSSQQKLYRLYSDYYRGRHELKFSSAQFASQQAHTILSETVMALRENLCPAAVSAFTDGISIASWGDDAADKVAADLGLSRLEAFVNRAGFRDGDAFAIVWPTADNKSNTVLFQQPAAMVPTVDVDNLGVLSSCARIWVDNNHYGRVNLYYPDRLERWVTTDPVRHCVEDAPNMPASADQWRPEPDSDIVPHTFGAVPVCWWKRDPESQLSHGNSVLADVIPLQDAMNKMLADLIITSEDWSRPMLYLLNHAEQSATNPYIAAQQAGAADKQTTKPRKFNRDRQQIFTTDGGGPFGRLDPPDLTRLNQVQQSFTDRVAHVVGVPSYYFAMGGDVPSGESLRVLSTRRTAAIQAWQRDAAPVWKGLSELLGMQGANISWRDAMPLDPVEKITVAVAKRRDLGYALSDAIADLGEPDAAGIVERAAAESVRSAQSMAQAFMDGRGAAGQGYTDTTGANATGTDATAD